MLKVISGKEVFERVYPLPDEPIEKHPVFKLKKLSMGEVNSINDRATMSTGAGQIQFLGGTVNRLKLYCALVGWKNVVDDDNKEVQCIDDNIDKLPPDIAFWLEKEIDKLNGFLGMTPEERKNS